MEPSSGARDVHQTCTRRGSRAGLETTQVPGNRGVVSSRRAYQAERGGFEPPIRFNPYNGLANRHPSRRNTLIIQRAYVGINDTPSLPLPYGPADMPPDLAVVVSAWPDLPEPIRAGILAMVRAAGKSNE